MKLLLIIIAIPSIFLALNSGFTVIQREFRLNETTQSDAKLTCPIVDASALNVHLIPHTHNDPGWITTVEDYYNGNYIPGGVSGIIDSVISSLESNKNRKFIYAEMSYLWRWLKDHPKAQQDRLMKLIKNGQFELVCGGWTMNDEATAHYVDMIEQHDLGFGFIKKFFGKAAVPKIGWQIDPFGHSRDMASLMAQFGFDGMFLGRISHDETEFREKTRSMEMMWNADPNLQQNGSIFTVKLPGWYDPPEPFLNFEVEPLDGAEDFNISKTAPLKLKESDVRIFQKIASVARKTASKYRTNNVIFTMGCDFCYKSAETWFRSMDYIIALSGLLGNIESMPKVKFFYSTPRCYLQAVWQQGLTFPTKTDDFLPYAHRPHAFWVGFYTSRPHLKYAERHVSGLLQALYHLSIKDNSIDLRKIQKIRRVISLLQHHDAITGTSTFVAINDYMQRLHKAESLAESIINDVFNHLLWPHETGTDDNFKFCALNISECTLIEDSQNFTMLAYNPHSKSVQHWFNVPAPCMYSIKNGERNIDYTCVDINDGVRLLPSRKTNLTEEMLFTDVIPPFTYNIYKFMKQNKACRKAAMKPTPRMMQNQYIIVYFDLFGHIKGIKNRKTGVKIEVKQTFGYYRSSFFDNVSPQAAGMYVSRHNNEPPKNIRLIKSKCVKYSNIQECKQTYENYVNQTIRLFNNADFVELDWVAMPAKPISAKEYDDGADLITRFTFNHSTGTFYTISNGRLKQERIRNERHSFQFRQTEKSAGNYYPINNAMFFKMNVSQFTILNDRPQAGGAATVNSLELLIHRKLTNYNDMLGVSEGLNDLDVDNTPLRITGRHFLHFGSIKDGIRFYREKAQQIFHKPVIAFSKRHVEEYANQIVELDEDLPVNLNVLTFKRLPTSPSASNKRYYLLRLENYYEKDELDNKDANVSITTLFPGKDIIDVIELTLGGERKLSSVNRLGWNFDGDNNMTYLPEKYSTIYKEFTVFMAPMQIRTFKVVTSIGSS